MSLRTVLVPSLSIVLLACGALTAEAQSGPVSGGKPATGTGGKLTAARVATLLKGKLESSTNGVQTAHVTIERDGWQYEMFIDFLPDGKVFDIVTRLSGPNPKLTQAQTQGLQQMNEAMKKDQKFFNVNKTDNCLYLEDINFLTTMTEQQFMNALNAHIMTLRQTYDLWKSN